MRNVTIAAVLAAAAMLAASSSAKAETWCRNGTLCVFPSYKQCISSVGVFGGTCTRQVSRSAPQPRAATSGRSSYAQYSSSPLPTNLHPSKFSCSN